AARRRTNGRAAAPDAVRRLAAVPSDAGRGYAGARMILRILNLIVVGVLILAAAYVYRIKFDSTVQAERLAKIRGEVRRERDTIAALRAQWSELDNPARIEALAKRFLPLKPIEPTQFSSLDQLPERPPALVPPDTQDPIGAFLENTE